MSVKDRLWWRANQETEDMELKELLADAHREIERLREALQKIADQDEHMFHEIGIARKALND